MDIDIDVKTTFDAKRYFPSCVIGSQVVNNILKPHPCGAYIQNMPVDPITGLAAITFKDAEDNGFMKFDFLHNTAYNQFESREEILTLLDMEPNWDLLLMPSCVAMLPQIAKHYVMCSKVRPRSILALSDVLALIRPGKAILVDRYLKDPDYIRDRYLYATTDGSYGFKKSHAVAYAQMIVLCMHTLE